MKAAKTFFTVAAATLLSLAGKGQEGQKGQKGQNVIPVGYEDRKPSKQQPVVVYNQLEEAYRLASTPLISQAEWVKLAEEYKIPKDEMPDSTAGCGAVVLYVELGREVAKKQPHSSGKKSAFDEGYALYLIQAHENKEDTLARNGSCVSLTDVKRHFFHLSMEGKKIKELHDNNATFQNCRIDVWRAKEDHPRKLVARVTEW